MIKRLPLLAILALIVLITYVVTDTLISAGSFKTIEPHFNGLIEKIDLPVAGPEDIEVDGTSGLAFISCDDKRSNFTDPGSISGAILLLDINDSLRRIRNITPPQLTDFHPHGISLFHTKDGRKILFIINHRMQKPRQVVERMEWRNDSLIHLETIEDEKLMTSPNDLAATGERSFYVTNDHYYSEPGLGRTVEEYLQRAISYVNYYDGKSFKKVADHIAYANGVQVDPDGQTVYVASVTGRKILVYKRKSDDSLELSSEVNVETGVDNIDLDENGDLLIGCHPQLLKFVAHGKDPKNFSPSQVIKINKIDFSVEEIFLHDGSIYSGSTVAADYQNKILVGSVFEPAFLILHKD
jgi:arylesterase/paraoxonase